MITLTKRDSEKTIFYINHKLIEKIEDGLGGHAIIKMVSQDIISVLETKEEIKGLILSFEKETMAKALIEALEVSDYHKRGK